MPHLSPTGIARAPWLFDTKPFEIVEGVYYVGNTSVSCHLFDTGDGLLLLDTAYLQTTHLLLESIRQLGFDPKDVKWILHSHAHVDHIGATRCMVEKYGCKTYLGEADLPLMKEQSELNYCAAYGQFYEPPYDCYFETDVAVKPGDVLTFGNITVDCHCAAGHTPGTMCYVFHLPGGLNAAMHGGIGRNTLRRDYAMRFGLGDTWRRAYVESLKRLHGLKVDVVLGNHPEQSDTFGKLAARTDDHNPFIDPTEWERFLDRTMAKYEDMARKEPI